MLKVSVLGKSFEIASNTQVTKMQDDYQILKNNFDALMSVNLNKGSSDDSAWSPMDSLKAHASVRPTVDNPMVSTDHGAKIAVYPFPLSFLYQMVKNIDALRIPIDVLNREIHRNGFEVVPRYRYKCKKCKKEFNTKPLEMNDVAGDEISSNKPKDKKKPAKKAPKNDKKKSDDGEDNLECDVCHGTNFTQPNPKHRQTLVNLIERKQNNNNQTFNHISKQIERDLDISDMAFVLLLKRYKKKSDKTFRRSVLDEIMRVNPSQVYIIADYDGRLGFDDQGNEIFFCPEHRQNGRVMRAKSPMGDILDSDSVPTCSICKFECLKAVIEVNSSYQTTVPNPKVILYGMNEVIMCNGKYWPDLLYGYSPIYTVWSKAMALSHMDEYIRKYFDKMRPPKGLLVIGSRNYQSLQKAFDDMKTRMKEDPYALNPLMVETERGGRNMVQYVDLTGSLQDLQFIDIRDEFRRSIGAMYGVLPFFSGDIPTGWNNEGMEAMVTNRAVQAGQKVLLENIYDPLVRMLGVYDWIFQLKTGEEMDELRDEQLEAQKIANATSMKGMGFRVEKDAEGNFVFSQKPIEEVMDDRMSQANPSHNTESQTEYGGMPNPKQRPSDEGGVGQGHPASGPSTSPSKKSNGHYRVKV